MLEDKKVITIDEIASKLENKTFLIKQNFIECREIYDYCDECIYDLLECYRLRCKSNILELLLKDWPELIV